MSEEFSQAIVRGSWFVAGIVAVLPGVLLAAEPKAPQNPSVSAAERDGVNQSAPQPAPSAPIRPVRRTPAAFTPQMPLSEAIEILRNCTTPPLNIVVLWRSLDNAEVYRDTPIGIDGLPGLRVRQYLDMLVLSLSAGATDRIAYVVQGGVVTIGVTAALPAPRFETRVYDIRDLTAPPANYSLPSMGFGGLGYGGVMGRAGTYGGQGPGYAGSGPGSLPGVINNSSGTLRTRSGAPRNR